MAKRSLASKIGVKEGFYVDDFKGENVRNISFSIKNTISNIVNASDFQQQILNEFNLTTNKVVSSIKGLTKEALNSRKEWLKQEFTFKNQDYEIKLRGNEWINGYYLKSHAELTSVYGFNYFIKELREIYNKQLNVDYYFKKGAKISELKTLETAVYANKEAVAMEKERTQAILNLSKSYNELLTFDKELESLGRYDDAMKNISSNESVLNGVDDFLKELDEVQQGIK